MMYIITSPLIMLIHWQVSEGRDQLSRGGGDNMPHPTNQVGGVSETQLAAYEQMTSFLSAFISHVRIM